LRIVNFLSPRSLLKLLFYLGDVVEYVNARATIKAERSVIAGIIDSLDTDYAGGASQFMYMNELNYKDNR